MKWSGKISSDFKQFVQLCKEEREEEEEEDRTGVFEGDMIEDTARDSRLCVQSERRGFRAYLGG